MIRSYRLSFEPQIPGSHHYCCLKEGRKSTLTHYPSKSEANSHAEERALYLIVTRSCGRQVVGQPCPGCAQPDRPLKMRLWVLVFWRLSWGSLSSVTSILHVSSFPCQIAAPTRSWEGRLAIWDLFNCSGIIGVPGQMLLDNSLSIPN